MDVCGTVVKQFGTCLEWLSVELDLNLFAVLWTLCNSFVFVLSVACLVSVLGVAVSVDSWNWWIFMGRSCKHLQLDWMSLQVVHWRCIGSILGDAASSQRVVFETNASLPV